jgi:Holliday junction resolvase RusA-like endonuclease
MRVLLCLLLLPGLAVAEIYRWTDANGQVHFGQRPNGQGAQQIEVKPQVVDRDQLTREREARTSQFYDARRQEQAQANASAKQTQAKRAQECQKFRQRLASIPEGRRYFRDEGNGKRSYYSDEQLDNARKQLQQEVAERC